MKKIFFAIVLVMFIGVADAQINNPVLWTYSAKKIADKTYELHITATIGNNWHLYAQDAGEGPVPTQITFTANPLIKLDGKVKEVGKMEKSFDKNFNSTLKFYANKVDFVQKIKVKSSIATVIKGSVNYMVCNDKQCLPPKDVLFSIKVEAK
jgi:DsbC/DsbD-like thiol-disulfide interchange protein